MNEWQEEWREQRDSYGYKHRGSVRDATPKRPSFVYFIQAEHGGPVMIGWSYSPEYRLKAFQKHSPYELVLRKVVAGTVRLERALHRRWHHYRLLGKWFEPQPDMPGCLYIGRVMEHAASWLDEEGAVVALERQADAERIRKRQQAREEREAQKRKEEPLPPSVAKGFALVGRIGNELLGAQAIAPK
jgi:Meiotically up-regulated gene 113